MGEVFALTLGNVLKSLLFVSLGYFLCRSKKLPADTPKVLSTITTMLFYPAYSINNLSKNFTIERVADKLTVLGLGVLCLGLVFLLALLFSRILGRTDLEKRTIIYAFTISNYVNPMYRIAEGINAYKATGKRYGYIMEGEDHLADINAGVTEIVEENIELKQRVKNLKEEK